MRTKHALVVIAALLALLTVGAACTGTPPPGDGDEDAGPDEAPDGGSSPDGGAVGGDGDGDVPVDDETAFVITTAVELLLTPSP